MLGTGVMIQTCSNTSFAQTMYLAQKQLLHPTRIQVANQVLNSDFS